MPPKASGSRPRRSTQQSQPNRRSSRRAPADSEEEDEDAEQNRGGADGDVDMDDALAGKSDESHSEIARKANDLVRLALFMEHKRIPLKREDISKKVMGTTSARSSFTVVFEMAQTILRNTLGMELVELRSKAELEKTTQVNGTHNEDLDEAKNAVGGSKKKAASAGSKTYILRSTLDPVLINFAAQTDDEIVEAENNQNVPEGNPNAAVEELEDDDDDLFGKRNHGSIIAWNKTDQLGATGIVYVVLALILASGRVISDVDLRSHLKRLRLPATSMIPLSAQSTHRSLTLDSYLTLLVRQGFIDKHRIGETGKGKGKAGAGNKGKRGRSGNDDNNDGANSWEWRWGPRAQSEVGEVKLANFLAEFMLGVGVDDDNSDSEGGGGRRDNRRGAEQNAKMVKMVKGIERAAGGVLSDIR